MNAAEEMEKLEREMRDKAARLRNPPNEVFDLSPIADWFDERADRLSAIREAMGKGEPAAEVRGLMGNYGPALKAMTIAAKDFLPVGTLLYAATPPADSAQLAEPFGYLHLAPGRMPGFHYKSTKHEEMLPVYLRPKTDSAQGLVEALEDFARGPLQVPQPFEQYVKTKAELTLRLYRERLAAHKSEGKG